MVRTPDGILDLSSFPLVHFFSALNIFRGRDKFVLNYFLQDSPKKSSDFGGENFFLPNLIHRGKC